MGVVAIEDLLGWARRAADMYEEADELVSKVKESLASSSAARKTEDQEELRQLLDRAHARRQQASANLDEALAALGG